MPSLTSLGPHTCQNIAVSPCDGFSEVFDIVSSKLIQSECILFSEGAHGNEWEWTDISISSHVYGLGGGEDGDFLMTRTRSSSATCRNFES